ncbi:hypothetical protein MAPG_11752 [Magnaporthiopsis poae ATCC 64411]|uniref:Uncharacterized protein n=1 Tax=Magnaporthiopsis poae (strain ATCC 64411 / 73-15) TaxID=644358 RepID=A0A0C4EG36_MAGP6|nr:hypothetical protein MAPG_11752 [Magnaporthiopsis poae ATCC 64411]
MMWSEVPLSSYVMLLHNRGSQRQARKEKEAGKFHDDVNGNTESSPAKPQRMAMGKLIRGRGGTLGQPTVYPTPRSQQPRGCCF